MLILFKYNPVLYSSSFSILAVPVIISCTNCRDSCNGGSDNIHVHRSSVYNRLLALYRPFNLFETNFACSVSSEITVLKTIPTAGSV